MKTKVFIKKCILTIFAILGYLFCIPIFAHFFWNKNTWRILRYHSVGDKRVHETNIQTHIFEEHLKYLQDNYTIISIDEGCKTLSDNTILINHSVSITFDDGYMDNYTCAYPVLQKYSVPATIFIISDYIGTEDILHHDIKDIRENNYLMNWNQIKSMDPTIISIGSHTSSHCRLSTCTDTIFNEEILKSKQTIENKLKRKTVFISYPFGTKSDFNNKWPKFLQKAGFKAGFMAQYGWNTNRSNTYTLRRIGVESSDTLFTLRAKLNGALDLFFLCAESMLGRTIIRTGNKLFGTLDYE
ncbi:MAG: polysaccharide deacetylase family protein [Candidatus Ancaeobacter aquaticus]|nr:polysaccharide deacetylase family protein [Candidatus Ancaeobacter aquaticus]